MANINLLPWREALRQKRNKEFQFVLAISALSGLLVSALCWLVLNTQVESQNKANQLIVTATDAKVDKLKSLDGLQAQGKELKDRMEAVKSLEQDRPILVRIFDELPRAMPKNMYLTSFKRNKDVFTIEGAAESPAVVSEFMRNLDVSPWYKDASMISYIDADIKPVDPSIQAASAAVAGAIKPIANAPIANGVGANAAGATTLAAPPVAVGSLAPNPEDSYGKFVVTANLETVTPPPTGPNNTKVGVK